MNFCLRSALVLALTLLMGNTETQARPGGGARRGGGPGVSAGGRGNFGGAGNVARPGGPQRELGRPQGRANLNLQERPNLNADRAPGNARPAEGAGVRGFLGIEQESRGQLSTREGEGVGARREQAAQANGDFNSRNEPFSQGWYAEHPQAWQYTHPHADAAAVGTFAATAAWLGWAAAPAASYEAGYAVSGDSGSAEQSQEAAELASAGDAEAANSGEWLRLGVYTLAAKDAEASAMLELAVNKAGILRGSYHDLLSGDVQRVQGAIDKQSQRAAWSVGEKGSLVFQTGLNELTQPSASVSLHFASDKASLWHMVRLPSTALRAD